MTVNERVNFLITELEHGNKSAFAEKVGTKGGVIGDIVGGRLNKPSFSVLEKIVVAYPLVNTDWLIKGQGEPFKREGTTAPAQPGTLHHYVGNSNNKIRVGGVPTTDNGTDIENCRQRIEELKEEVKELKAENKSLLARLLQYLPKQE